MLGFALSAAPTVIAASILVVIALLGNRLLHRLGDRIPSSGLPAGCCCSARPIR
ncbi:MULTISPECIES: hypothetical protein [Bradyrhizobium]|uniref:hypothetical protein n=1 Tax=Bradyrhizobium TaxID=374 RepID=UPI00211DCAB5|nr:MULTISPECIES: hypothetical protein [Bradyrhizobium]